MAKHQILGWVVGVALFLLLLQLLPEARCADGWASPSIGRQGACSHHGGVRGNGIYGILILGLSIAAGIMTTRKLKQKDVTVVIAREAQKQRKELELIQSSIKDQRNIEFVHKKINAIKNETQMILPHGFNYTVHTHNDSNRHNQSKETDLIQSAIKYQRKIEFIYKKPNANKPEMRTILPHGFKYVAYKHDSGSTHCVVGFCDKRKEQRTFALKRMSNIRVL